MKPHPRIRKSIKWGGLALSLLLVGVWVRSEWAFEGLRCGSFQLLSDRGAFQVSRYTDDLQVWVYRRLNRLPPDPRFSRIAFQSGGWGWQLVLQMWLAVPLSLLATAAAWRLDALARRRARAGVCPKCGYDRAGLAASAVCPECGAAPAHAPPPASS